MNTRAVTLSTRNVGRNFATIGVIRDQRGRTIWSGDERPFGFTDAALGDARKEAALRGYQIVESR